MSTFSKLVGKIPVVGHALNQVGKVLPSGGQLLGGTLAGIPGMMVGGSIDGNTTPLQKKIGAGATALAGGVAAAPFIGGAASAMGRSSIAGKLGGLIKSGAGAIAGDGNGGIDWGKLLKLGGTGAALLGQHQATNTANDFYNKQNQRGDQLFNMMGDQYKSEAPLRQATLQKLTDMVGAKRNTGYGS